MIAAVTQAIICRVPGLPYSGTVDNLLMLEWLIGTLFLGFNAPSQRMAFYGSVALSVPPISYSMIGYGFLEMGGMVHALCFGTVGAVINKVVHNFKSQKRPCNSGS